MSSINFDFSCIDKLQDELREMGRKGINIEKKALEEGAEPILNEIIKNCPVRTGKAKKHLKISKPKKEKGRLVVKIGVNKEDNSEAFYLKFYEWGTSRGQVAIPFMRPAFENKKKEALEITKKVIMEELRK